MEFLTQYGLFLAKIVTVVIAILVVVGFSFAFSKRHHDDEKLVIKNLNDRYDAMRDSLQSSILSKKELKAEHKKAKAAIKNANKKEAGHEQQKRLYVIDFDGDIKASEVASLREEVTAVLTTATKNDEVVVRLDNSGGIVHEHGLAASQLLRVREAGIPLTVAVDKVAASGGYMMACVADKILAAPFAVIGSVGVLAQLPNFNRLLEKHGIEFEQETAGEFKRTLTMFGKNTDEERAKLREQIEETHELFKAFVSEHRPQLEIDKIATGEHWYGKKALELKLVDELITSDDYLLAASKDSGLYHLEFSTKKSISERLLSSVQLAIGGLLNRARQDNHDSRYQ